MIGTPTSRRRLVAGAAALALLFASACGGDDETASDFCEKYRTFEDTNTEIARQNLDNPEDIDLEDVKAQYAMLSDQVEELSSTTPEEIAEDVDTVGTAADELATEVQDASNAQDLVTAITDAADNAPTDSQEASDRIDDWVNDNCDAEGDTK